jgi:hypothetical protein
MRLPRPSLQEDAFKAFRENAFNTMRPYQPPLKQAERPAKRANLWGNRQHQTWVTESGCVQPRALPANFVDPPRGLLSAEEIRRWLLRFRHDQTFQEDGHRVPYTMLARFAGVHRDTLHELLRTQRVALLTRIKLTPVIKAIEAGRLRFIQDKSMRPTQKWSWEVRGPPLLRHESGERREKSCWSSCKNRR